MLKQHLNLPEILKLCYTFTMRLSAKTVVFAEMCVVVTGGSVDKQVSSLSGERMSPREPMMGVYGCIL